LKKKKEKENREERERSIARQLISNIISI